MSFTVEAGRTYTIETAAGTPPEDVDTVLFLYDSNGTTVIDSNDDTNGRYSRIDYIADANKTVYAKVVDYYGYTTGAYALSVTKHPWMGTRTSRTVLPSGDAGHCRRPRAAAHDRPRGRRGLGLVLGQRRTHLRHRDGRGIAGRQHGHGPVLYDSDGMTWLDGNDDHDGSLYSRIDYTADADETLYAFVQGAMAAPAPTLSA